MPPETLHRSDCPVELRLAEMEKSLRLMPDPANFGRMNLPYEELPDGPILVSGMDIGLEDCIVCSGVVIKSTVIDVPGLGWRPSIILSFNKAQGGPVRPILFVTEADQSFTELKTLVYHSVNKSMSAVKEKRNGG